MPRPADSERPARQAGEYVVVARRYRPKSFDELVGQNQVSQALASAINTNRVGHAYLFTGARGVGKTSTARIFAKSLNCVNGPTPQPCNQCDICESIAVGGDVDVLEIDGASNRGIDEIRQLRSNVHIRPSRARFKIYIIDEVHMLTLQAFNALLKTLEEPPEHVKFIFCTTDADKIPITILSRCQRFDFPPVEASAIVERLRFIVQNEGMEADEEALQLLARRANGSLRDSQSLLEQLLSLCQQRIRVEDVHAMLGTAQGGMLTALVSQLADRNVPGALRELDAAIQSGVDAGQLAEQLVGYFRDMMTAVVGCGPELMLYTGAADYPGLCEMGSRVGMETLLAIVQVLDHTVSRMRYSPHVRTLLEVALVRICKLDSLDELSEIVGQLRLGTTGGGREGKGAARESRQAAGTSGAEEKKTEQVSVANPDSRRKPEARSKPKAPAKESSPPIDADDPSLARQDSTDGVSYSPRESSEPRSAESLSREALSPEALAAMWKETLATLGDMTADFARHAESVRVTGANRLVASFGPAYILHKESCERPERRARLESALAQVSGRPWRLEFELLPGELPPEARPHPVPSARQRLRETEKHALVRRAMEMFDAEVVRVDEPRDV